MPSFTFAFRIAIPFLLTSLLPLVSIQASIEFRQTLQLEEVEIGNLLTWSTGTQGSVTHFTVEKSVDGKSYSSIGEVPVHFAGENEIAYSFLDLRLGESAAYYRLVCRQGDGEQTITPSIYSQRTTGNNLRISGMTCTVTQSPFICQIESIRQMEISVTLYTLDGAEVLHYPATVQGGDNQMVLDMDKLSAGYYLLELNAHQETERLILQKIDPEKILQDGYVIKE
ncbi:MAG: hypothetical protein K9I85_09700 [Saprospiraceae bacterium]|nr:hypothetical protein [Saprospiraceae bacterium]